MSDIPPFRESVLPLSSWPGLLSPVFWFLLVVQLVLAIAVRESWVAENSYAREFAIAARSMLLSVSKHADIGAHANSTNFPDVALLSHAWLWFSMAALLTHDTIAAVLNWNSWMTWLPRRLPQVAASITASTAAVGLFAILAGPIVFTMVPVSSSFVGHAELGSRLTFGAFSAIFLFLWQLLAYGWLPVLGYVLVRSRSKGAA